MINIREMANNAIQGINDNQTITLTKQTGYTTADDGSRVPIIESVAILASQVQPLSSSELKQIEGLNISTESRGIYFYCESHGVLRAGQNDGDKITLADGTRWLVVQVLEQWTTWAKVAVARQL